MALDTLTWNITNEQTLGDMEPDWAGMSLDSSGNQVVNFLAHIKRHIDNNSQRKKLF